MVTMRDVAKKAGVSVATVSRVINNKGAISQETERWVMDAIEKLNYKPNEIARSLSNRKSKIIALIVPSINNPFFPKLVKAIEDEAQSKGYKIFLCNTDDSRERLVGYLESFRHNFVDGIIINSQNLLESDLKELKKHDIPIVTTDRSLPSNLLSSISVNNRYGGQLATRHLLEIGCERIGHLRGPEDIITANDRFWGYRDEVKRLNWYNRSWSALVEFSVEGGYRGMKELFQRHPEIDGVFATNDLVAIGALKAAVEWGREVPDDLAIIGFDGVDITNLMVPRISTIQQPVTEIGKLAVKEIIRSIENPETDIKKYELEVSLVQRESTML